jgi:hypothetical protein
MGELAVPAVDPIMDYTPGLFSDQDPSTERWESVLAFGVGACQPLVYDGPGVVD